MAAPSSTIYLMNGYVILEQYSAVSLSLDSTRGKFAKVVQVNTQSEPLAVDDIVIYNPKNEIRFKEGTSYFSAVLKDDIVFVFEDALP